MNNQRDQLASELKIFNGLSPSSSMEVVTDAYKRILLIVQAFLLTRDDPESNTRAWSMVNDDAYKHLTEMQEGKSNSLNGLKQPIGQVGQILNVV